MTIAACIVATGTLFGAESPSANLGKIRSPRYHDVQSRLCRGWNTWYNDSMTAHTFLPGGFTVSFGMANADGKTYWRTFRKDFQKKKGIVPGLRADDGRYTSAQLNHPNFSVKLETATDGNDFVALVTPQKPSRNLVVAEIFYAWESNGLVGRAGSTLTSSDFTFSTTGKVVPLYTMSGTAPRLAVTARGKTGFYTGRNRTLAEIEKLIAARRAEQEKRVAAYGDKADAFSAVQTILAWNTVYDPANKRAVTPVSRNWAVNNGGWLLFEWDTYFAAWMFSFFNKDLAYANAVEITKAVSKEGFVMNFVTGRGTSSPDRSQPPVGSLAILEIYKRFKDAWLLEETYDELIAWNRWWPKARTLGDGYLAWGSHTRDKNGKRRVGSLKFAKFESGLDNSPIFDNAKMLPDTCTMDQADVGLMSLYIADCKALAEIAEILGRTSDKAELLSRAGKYADKLKTMWDEKTGIYRDIRIGTGAFLPDLSPCNFYPLIAGVPTPEQAGRMMDEHYFNPKEFHGEYVIPSIMRSSKGFDMGYWRGRVWGPMNFLVYLGMRNYDLPKARKDLVTRSAKLLMKCWKQYGGICENYNANTGFGGCPGYSDPFYHWGALLSFIGLME